MLSWLVDPVLEDDEEEALKALAFILAGEPRLLFWYPAIQDQFDYLFVYPPYWHVPQDVRDRVNESLRRLTEGWATGMTGGYNVSISKAKGRRGVTSQLFPNLGEREGYFASAEAIEQEHYARKLSVAYDDLMARLETPVQWRTVGREYREGDTHVVQGVAERIKASFDSFCKHWGISGGPLSEEELHNIVREGLEDRKGGNPRHKIACGLLGMCDLEMAGKVLGTKRSLIESTLKTLRKHGIGERSRSTKTRRRPPR